jgi:hypothetical protein
MQRISILIVLCAFQCGYADTTIYKSTDAKGKPTFSDRQPANSDSKQIQVPGMSTEEQQTATAKLQQLQQEDKAFNQKYEQVLKLRQEMQLQAQNSYNLMQQAEAELKDAQAAAKAAQEAIPPLLYDSKGLLLYNPEREYYLQKADFLQQVVVEAQKKLSKAQLQYGQDREKINRYRPDYGD